MSSLKLIFLDPLDTRWQVLATANPQANIFHHPAWTRLLAECYGYRPFIAAVLDPNDNICVGLPIMEIASPISGHRWISLPFTDHCVPLGRDSEGEARSCLITSLIHLSRDHRIPRTELRYEVPPDPAIGLYSDHVLHTLPLCPDREQVAANFHSTHRRNITVAKNRGVHIEWGVQRRYMEAFYRLHLQTRHRQGVPIQPWKFFDMLGSLLIDQGLGFVMLAYKDDLCLAAAVFLHWQHTLTYKYGASTTDGLNLRPNNLLFSSAINWGCENGYTLFDMGKTNLTNTGLRAFKKGWGANETPLVYSTLAGGSSRSINGSLMTLLQKLIRNSPAWVCRATGELLYKHFGS